MGHRMRRLVLGLWMALLVAGAAFGARQFQSRILDAPHVTAAAAVGPPIDPRFKGFADGVARKLGPNAIVYGRADILVSFVGQLGVHLFYRGSKEDVATSEEWQVLEGGAPADVAALLSSLGIGYVMIQSAQPLPHVFELCVHGNPVEVSPTPDPAITWTFQVYAIDTCRAK